MSQHGFFTSLFSAFGDVSALILFTVNFGGVIIAMLLGFFSHDPDKDFDHSETAQEEPRAGSTRSRANIPVALQGDPQVHPRPYRRQPQLRRFQQ